MGKKSKRKKGEATLGIRARNGIGSQPQQRQSRPNDDDDDDCAAAMAMEEEVRSMKTSDIKSELESRGISTRAVIKRGELIHALVLARKEGMALPPNGMSESTQQPSVSMQQRQRLGNECSHGSGPALGRLTTKGKFFLAAFEENLHEFSHKIVSNDILRAVCESNPTRFWVELMEAGLLNPRYPGNCRPDYRNRDECYNLIALLVFKGTHFLLQAERCDQESHRKTNILLAGFAAHTAQYVEENSRSKSGDLNMLTFSSKGGGLWHIKERETVEFIHSRNGCNCLKVITQTSGRKPRQLLPRQPPSLQQQQGFDLEQTMIDQIDSLTLGRAEILIPDGATCYFCLDELDEAGMPLVRDCSCRGDSAGFAHLSCIVQYAKQKCKLAQGTDLSSYLEPWITCLGCKQMYQNQLSHDLTSALLSFTETTYGYPGNCDSDKLRIMIALRENITTAISSTRSTKIVDGDIASKSNENTKMDCEMLIKKLMSMVDEMKKEKHMSGWVYTPPTSLEYKFYELLSGFEARGYKFLARQPPSLQQQQGFDLEQTMIDQIDSLTLGRAEILIPDGATCYFCLDELDEAGMPLVRDCSCRGDSAGFAHLSCIVQYAKQKCKLAQGTDLSSYLEPWITCLGCKQMYQNQLSHDLTSALLSFTETTYGYPGNCDSDKLRIMIALRENITTAISSTRSTKIVDGDIASKSNENTKMDCEMLIKKLMSMVDEMKKEKHMSGWVYTPPTSLEYKFYELLSGFEARGYKFLAEVSAIDNSTEAGFKTSIAYYERARTIYYQLGMNADAELMDAIIVVYRANLAEFEGGDGKLTASVAYEMAKSFYERSLESSDPTSLKSIEAGLMYGPALAKKGAPFSIEGERLVMKLTADSRRVHGPAHEWTLRADKALKKCRKRFVFVLPDDWKGMLDKTLIQEADMFQALRYDSDLNVCVVTGPITMPTRCQDQEEIRHVAIDLILPCPGCPVICHGLVTALTAYGLENAAHLNGKLGAVKSFRSGALQVVVHFENQSRMPAVVKTENLRIAFDLPSEDPSANDPRVKTFFDVGEKDEPQGKILSRTDSVKYEGDDASVPRDIRLKLEDARKHYAYMIKSFGLTSQETVGPCVEYTQYLLRAHRNIEAERILSKMVTSCRRVNGPEHDITRMAEAALEACKSRFVHVMHRTGSFLALRSENDKCVVTDPIREDDERTFHVAFDLILPFKGCPVKCHGLVSASYLNGEVGEVRGYHENKNGIRLKVRFENKSYHPVMVKPANLRIVFELPKSSRVE